MAQYQGAFEQLLEEFLGRIVTKTALMTIDIALELAKVAAMVKDISKCPMPYTSDLYI